MKALTYLLIAVVGLAFAAGIMACKKDGEPKGEPPDYECEACGEAFASTAELEEHVSTSHPPDYECEACGEVFASAAELEEHVSTSHPPDYECEACGEVFASTAELEEHSATHGPQ